MNKLTAGIAGLALIGGLAACSPSSAPASTTAEMTGACTLGTFVVMTLTNNSSVAAEVNGYSVVFYDSSGTELGSASTTVADTFIEPGQSLSWHTTPDSYSIETGYFTVPAGSVSCGLAEWTHPAQG